MYKFDRETKSIISPIGEHLKGKAVTDELNGLYGSIMSLADCWQALHYVMATMDSILIGSGANGNPDGQDDASSGAEPSEAGDDV